MLFSSDPFVFLSSIFMLRASHSERNNIYIYMLLIALTGHAYNESIVKRLTSKTIIFLFLYSVRAKNAVA